MTVKKKVSKSARAKSCDVMFSKIVRVIGYCQNCPSTENLQAAHGFSRSYRAVRWDFRNCFALCRSCHVYFTHRPLEWDVWLRKAWGDVLYDELRALALTYTYPDIEVLYGELKARLEQVAA